MTQKKGNGKKNAAKSQVQRAVTPKQQQKVPPALRIARNVAGRMPGLLGLAASGIVEGVNAIGGFGDYTVSANSLTTRGTSGVGVPQFQVMNGNRVVHRECIGVLTSTGSSFAILKKLTINPSDTIAFPWLSALASNYIMYDVHGAVIVFESNSSEYAASSGMGTVCIATRYDSREPQFSSMLEMQNSMFAVSAKPSHNIIHPIECKKGFQPIDTYYVRRGNESGTQYNYDKCTTYVGVEGLNAAAGTVIGRLWISYDIELKSPALPVVGGPTSVYTSKHEYYRKSWASSSEKNAVVYMSSGMTRSPTLSNTNLAEVTFAAPSSTNNTAVVVNSAGKFIRFYKAGTYLVSWNISGSGLDTTQDGEAIATFTSAGTFTGAQEQISPYGTTFSSTLASYTWQIVVKGTYDGDTSYHQLSISDLATGTITAACGFIESHPISASDIAPI